MSSSISVALNMLCPKLLHYPKLLCRGSIMSKFEGEASSNIHFHPSQRYELLNFQTSNGWCFKHEMCAVILRYSAWAWRAGPTCPPGDKHLVHIQPPHAGAGARGSDNKKLLKYKDHWNVHKRLDKYTYSATESWWRWLLQVSCYSTFPGGFSI